MRTVLADGAPACSRVVQLLSEFHDGLRAREAVKVASIMPLGCIQERSQNMASKGLLQSASVLLVAALLVSACGAGATVHPPGVEDIAQPIPMTQIVELQPAAGGQEAVPQRASVSSGGQRGGKGERQNHPTCRERIW